MRDITRIPIRFDRLLLINKQALADGLFNAGVILAFFDSLHPWFLWPLASVLNYVIVMFLGASILISRTLPSKEGNDNTNFLLPFLSFVLLRFYLFLTNTEVATFRAFIATIIQCGIFYVVFRANADRLRAVIGQITRLMALLMIVSLAGFLLYIFGFSLSGRSGVYGDNLYSFTNYYFFLLDDRNMWVLIPRFQSVFLEPSHLGIAAVMLLMINHNSWKRWYCVALWVAVFFSFSLEAYVLSFLLLFLHRYMQHRPFLKGFLAICSVAGIVVVGSFFYNGGDNMINQLIVMRLEVDDGDLAGNNRTQGDFDTEFESFMSSSDTMFGREMLYVFGNSGYKVFIYDYGFVGLFLLALFYGIIHYNPSNKRAAYTSFVIAFLHFVVSGYMMWASCIISFYVMAQVRMYDNNLLEVQGYGKANNREQ